jgi:hypothetical protein
VLTAEAAFAKNMYITGIGKIEEEACKEVCAKPLNMTFLRPSDNC